MTSNERTYTVHLRNDGNVPRDYHVSGFDPTGELYFRGDSGPYTLQPGEEGDVALTVRVERRPLIGVPTFYPFETRVAQVDDGTIHRSNGQLRVTPLIPVWLLLLLPLLFACAALVIWRIPVEPPAATFTPRPTASTTVTSVATSTATPTETATETRTATVSPTASATATSTGTTTPTPTTTATGTPTPSPTATETATLTVTPSRSPGASGPFPPLTFSVSLTWRQDPRSTAYVIADVIILAQGGDGNYTHYRDDIVQPGPAFSYYWRRCSSNTVSFRVDSGDGQSVRVERAEFAPCSL